MHEKRTSVCRAQRSRNGTVFTARRGSGPSRSRGGLPGGEHVLSAQKHIPGAKDDCRLTLLGLDSVLQHLRAGMLVDRDALVRARDDPSDTVALLVADDIVLRRVVERDCERRSNTSASMVLGWPTCVEVRTHLEGLLGEREAVGLIDSKHGPRGRGRAGLAVSVDAHATTADRVLAVEQQARKLARVSARSCR